MCRYCLVKCAGFRLRSWMIAVAILCWLFALASAIYFLVMFAWDIVRVSRGDYIWQMSPERKGVRNHLWESHRKGVRRLCLFDTANGTDHTLDGVPDEPDPYDDDDDDTDAALWVVRPKGMPEPLEPLDEEVEPLPLDLERAAVVSSPDNSTEEDEGSTQSTAPTEEVGHRKKRLRRQETDHVLLKDYRLARLPPSDLTQFNQRSFDLRQSNETPEFYGGECLDAAKPENPEPKEKIRQIFANIFVRAEKRFSIVWIFITFIMLFFNIGFCITCTCLIVALRRKVVNHAVPWVVLSGTCFCLDIAYWVTRLAFTPPWGYYNTARIVITFLFVLLFFGLYFWAVVTLAQFFFYCFLVELDPTSPLIIQSAIDQKAMKHDIEN